MVSKEPGFVRDRSWWACGSAVAWLAAALLLVFWLMVGLKLHQIHEQALAEGAADLANLSQSFADQTARRLDLADQTLRGVRHDLLAADDVGGTGSNRSTTVMDSMLKRIRVVSATGRLEIPSGSVEPLDHSDREYFRVHAGAIPPRDRVVVSRPVVDGSTGRWTVYLSRPLLGPEGDFLGVVVLALSPEDLTTFYGLNDLGPLGAVGVIGGDGTVRAWGSRYSGAPVLGVPLAPQDALHPARASAGDAVVVSGPDGLQRVWSIRLIPEFDLAVVIGAPRQHLLTSYERQLWTVLGAGGLVTALAVVLVYVAISQRRSQDRLIDELMRQRAALATATQARAMFLENLSHELRTPLHGLLGTCELLQMHAASDDARTITAAARSSAAQLHGLLEMLIEAAALGSRGPQGQVRSVAVRGWLRDVVLEAQARFPVSPNTVHLGICAEVPERLCFDSDAITHLLCVLLIECLQRHPRGRVEVRAQFDAPCWLRLAVESSHPCDDPVPGEPQPASAEEPIHEPSTLRDELVQHLAHSAAVELLMRSHHHGLLHTSLRASVVTPD